MSVKVSVKVGTKASAKASGKGSVPAKIGSGPKKVGPKRLGASLKESAEAKARHIAGIADDKKALDIVTLHLSDFSALTDFFVICSVESAPQMDAIASEVRAALSAFGIGPLAVEGTRESDWMLVDYGDVILHIFKTGARAFYGLEHLWSDAPVLSPEVAAAPRRTRKSASQPTADTSDSPASLVSDQSRES